jgi:hypothetical protein
MSIKIEEIVNNKIVAKGTLKGITVDGITIVDEKESIEQVLSFDKIKKLIGKSVAISFTSKEEAADYISNLEE